MEIARAIAAGAGLLFVILIVWYVVMIAIIDASQMLDRYMRGIDKDQS